jgi:dTDP-4-amino-4,6-dideoxygalactose transaminase
MRVIGNPPPGTTVPFVDVAGAAESIREGFLADLVLLLESGAFTNGPAVADFEQAFADYCGVSTCIGVANGLDGIRLALLAAGIEPGDEVLVPANTFVATFEAVTQAGGRVVPVDVALRDYNIDVDACAAAAGPGTRFLLPVHLYGQLADMSALVPLAERHGIAIIEDACQSHGATRDGFRAGAGGLASAFSFYPGKNLGAFGDAGAIVTDDLELAGQARALREHGQTAKYRHDRIGYTSRLDTIQAIALEHKLPLLDGWNEQRRSVARFYDEALAGIGDLVLPPVPSGSSPVWHLYVVRTADPTSLGSFLAARGVATGRHYPEPPHLSRAYRELGHSAGDFPVTEALADQLLSLPIFPGMTGDQQEAVAAAVAAFFAGG